MSSSPWLTLIEPREQRPVPYLQVCKFGLSFFFQPVITFFVQLLDYLSPFQKSVWNDSPHRFCFNSLSGTGSDVKAPKKPERPRSSHTANHGSLEYKHSANYNETGADSRHSSTNIPALRDGNISPSSKNSEGNPNVLTDSQSNNQNGVDTTHTGQNNKDWDSARPQVNKTNSSSSHHFRDKDSALTSPQKHREKRKHCESVDSNKHKHKKRKHTQDARFEGHRISHLVKKRNYKKEDHETDDQKKSDDYVLAKLFKKSGRFFCAQTPVYLVK